MTDNQIKTAFTVGIRLDGSIFTEILETNDVITQKATTFDIYQSCKEIVSDIDSQLLAERVARTVVASLQPRDSATELKEKLLNALSDRGIDTPQA